MKLSKQLKIVLINLAKKRCGDISPCPAAGRLESDKSYTLYKNDLFFWFDDSKGSTKVIKIKIDKKLIVNNTISF